MNRFQLVIICFVLCGLFSFDKPRPAAANQPNILFVIADDWSYGHASIYGDKVIKTPNFDRVAREGALFQNAYCASPSCAPSRAAILTGQMPHRLEQGANLWGVLNKEYPNYTRILESQGYYVGLTRKGYGPGNFKVGGYEFNPAGKPNPDFATFFAQAPKDKPFCFWFGTTDPHRAYELGSGEKSGMQPGQVQVPGWLPDSPVVRGDILDYYFEVQRLDRELGEMMQILEAAGQLDNTIIVVTSDNGMPFPRAKANLYDSGTRMPLAIRWKGKIKPGQRLNEFVSLTDLAPTFLEAAGQAVPTQMTGKSLLPLLQGQKVIQDRHQVFFERERHANVRKGELGYPSRAIRTHDFLYIKNYLPERWPAGDPEFYHSVGPYGDIDDSPSKRFILEHQTEKAVAPFFRRGFLKRPADELYDLKTDPHQLNNLATNPKYAVTLKKLQTDLQNWQVRTQDPRATGKDVAFDKYPYYGSPARKGAPSIYQPPQPPTQ
jgi:N-sulfoglucosamine sulfohydrolase